MSAASVAGDGAPPFPHPREEPDGHGDSGGQADWTSVPTGDSDVFFRPALFGI